MKYLQILNLASDSRQVIALGGPQIYQGVPIFTVNIGTGGPHIYGVPIFT